MSEINYEARPLSRDNIRAFAESVRGAVGYKDTPYIPVAELLEFVLPEALEGFMYDIWSEDEMGATHGLSDPDDCCVILREDVYEGACEGVGRDRMTVVHELGHLLLHQKDRLTLRRATGDPVTYRDPEWQAKCFAGEFLVSSQLVNQFKNTLEVASAFGVSVDAAKVQLGVFKRAGIWMK